MQSPDSSSAKRHFKQLKGTAVLTIASKQHSLQITKHCNINVIIRKILVVRWFQCDKCFFPQVE